MVITGYHLLKDLRCTARGSASTSHQRAPATSFRLMPKIVTGRLCGSSPAILFDDRLLGWTRRLPSLHPHLRPFRSCCLSPPKMTTSGGSVLIGFGLVCPLTRSDKSISWGWLFGCNIHRRPFGGCVLALVDRIGTLYSGHHFNK